MQKLLTYLGKEGWRVRNVIKYMTLFISLTFLGSLAFAEAPLPPLDKVPKSLYILKKARVDADVGEPLIFPNEQQMRTLYYDAYFRRDRLPLEDVQKNN